jgi:hypothetical protein
MKPSGHRNAQDLNAKTMVSPQVNDPKQKEPFPPPRFEQTHSLLTREDPS